MADGGARVVPLVVVSPVRNESKYIRLTLDSMLAQTVRPVEWVIVDDGSDDDTPAIVESYAAKNPFIRLVRRQDRGFRQLGGGVVAAFDFGRSKLLTQDYRYIVKLDGDMSFPPRYLEVMIGELEANPRMAAVSGKVFRPEGKGYVEEFITNETVAGQFKLYKREAFEAIGGFQQTIMWDGIDIHRCRQKGWTTKSFYHPEARLIHHRLMGSSDKNVYKGRVRLGKAMWYGGYHPIYACASGMFRMHEKPRVIGGIIIVGAYFHALFRREPQIDDREYIRELHRWQMQQLRKRPSEALGRLLHRRQSAA